MCDQAVEYHNSRLTSTSVVYLEGAGALPVAYFSLSTDTLKLSEMEQFDLGLNFNIPIRAFPAVKITRLAVSTPYQSQGIGRNLLDMIEGMIYSMPMSARLLTVDADNNRRTLAFYEKSGFAPSLENAKHRENERRQRRRDDNGPPGTVSMWKDIFVEV